MKVMTILGTRPEIIRLSRVIPLLDTLCDHVLVHTGQNFDPALLPTPGGLARTRHSLLGDSRQLFIKVSYLIRR